MRLFKALLYSLVFSFSSLQSAYLWFDYPIVGVGTVFTIEPNGAYYIITSEQILEDVQNGRATATTDGKSYISTNTSLLQHYYNGYYYPNTTTWITDMTNSSYAWYSEGSCPVGLDDINGVCVSSAPTCPDGEFYDNNTSQCISSSTACTDGKIFSIEENSCITPVTTQSLDDTFFNIDGCPTVTEPQPYVPQSYSNSPTSSSTSLSHYTVSGSTLSDCYGFIWKCNYATKLFEKISYRVQDNLCFADKETYEGIYGSQTETEKLKDGSPCEKQKDLMSQICGANGYVGTCIDNGLYISNDTLQCKDIADEPKAEDCERVWHEVWNESTSSCECESGYSMNTFNDCWKSLDSNATSEQITADEKAQDLNDEAKTKDSKAKTQQESDNNATATSISLSTSSSNALSGIRKDINATNSKLGILEGLLKDINMKMDENGSAIANTTVGDSVTEFMNNIKDDAQSVIDTYNDTKAIIENPFQMQISNRACIPLSISAFGRTVELDIFTHLSIIRPVLAFIITIVIYILSIKIYIKGLGLKNE